MSNLMPLYIATGEYIYRFNWCIENIVHHLVQENIIKSEEYLETLDFAYEKLYKCLNDNKIEYAADFDSVRLFRNKLIHSKTANGYISDEQMESIMKNPISDKITGTSNSPCFVNMSYRNKKMSFIYPEKIAKHMTLLRALQDKLQKLVDNSKVVGFSYYMSGYTFEY